MPQAAREPKSRLCCHGGNLDSIAEVLEPREGAPGLHGLRAAVEVVWTEIVIDGAVLKHAVGGGEDRGGDAT